MSDYDYQINNALGTLNDNLGKVNDNVLNNARLIENVHSDVNIVGSNLQIVYNEVGRLAQEFQEYVKKAEFQHNLTLAETRIGNIRQELETRFGHHAQTRRVTVGILQADDLELVRKNTITTATEELMLSCPGYWLAPCLVAIAAWINDDPSLADRAVREAIRRDDEKTSLLFALICRRADRKSASLKWTQRYLANQDEENLDRKCVVILDAFASGLLGSDTEGVVAKQLETWVSNLSSKPGFIERQTSQWANAIEQKKQPFDGGYEYLSKYSRTWPQLEHIMEGAYLHATIFEYFQNIFNQHSSSEALKEQLDEILSTLVTAFDDEELPLRKEEKLNQLIIDYNGDLPRAKQSMAMEQTAFDAHKDFTQLLTDAAMRPETSGASVSTQKFAISLSKDWITHAYSDVVAKNRAEVPEKIEINIENFNETTVDGSDEEVLVQKMIQVIAEEENDALRSRRLSVFQQFSLVAGGIIAVVGLIMAFAESSRLLGIIAVIAGIALVLSHFSARSKVDRERNVIRMHFDNKRNLGVQILRATIAEIVDIRAHFEYKDAESTLVMDFLEQIKPDQFVKKLSDSTRRIKVDN